MNRESTNADTLNGRPIDVVPLAIEARSPSRRPEWAIVVVLILCAVVPYANTLFSDFVYDDRAQVLNNPYIQSFRYLREIFTTPVWSYTGAPTNYYRPLMMVGYLLSYQIFGPAAWAFHLQNILLNAAVVYLVFRVAASMLREREPALIAAVIFALHPIHIEAVSWISAASDSMVTLFYVTAFAAFISSEEAEEPRQRNGWRLLSLTLLTVALLTKEMAVTFFVIAGLYTFLSSKSSGTLICPLSRP